MKRLENCVESNFDRYWVEDQQTGCWNWTGAVSKGYGRLKVGGKGCKAYRFSFERAIGPIPVGAHVLHNCDNKLCVNPAHLRLGTHAENMADRKRTYAVPTGEKSPHAKLTQGEVDEIRRLVASGQMQKHVAAQFGTSGANVSDIVRGKSWPIR